MKKKELRALLAGMLNHLIDLDNDNERLTNDMLAWMKEARRLKKALEAAGYSVKDCPECESLMTEAIAVEQCAGCGTSIEHYHGCGTHARYVPKAYREHKG